MLHSSSSDDPESNEFCWLYCQYQTVMVWELHHQPLFVFYYLTYFLFYLGKKNVQFVYCHWTYTPFFYPYWHWSWVFSDKRLYVYSCSIIMPSFCLLWRLFTWWKPLQSLLWSVSVVVSSQYHKVCFIISQGQLQVRKHNFLLSNIEATAKFGSISCLIKKYRIVRHFYCLKMEIKSKKWIEYDQWPSQIIGCWRR